VPSTITLWRYLSQPQADPRVEGRALALSGENRFFHWPLEFPEVFAAGGFDVVLGNPPWERIKLQEQEFFAVRDREIAQAPNRAARERLIRRLPDTNPALYGEYIRAKHQAEAQSKFVRHGRRFPLCGRGDINTYAVFAELMRALLGPRGRAGLIVPTGIATDDTTRFFFQDLIEKGALVSLYDFENRQRIFPGIDSRIKFCLLTLTGREWPAAQAEFAFFLQQVADLKDEARRFPLTRDDLALLNPNTKTCPIFRSQRDAELTKAIYRRVPVLIKDGPPEENPWGIKFLRMFDMANDSHLFRTREQLESEGWELQGNIFCRGEEIYLPLYEAKMIAQYDHRASQVIISETATIRQAQPENLSLKHHQSPSCLPMSRYWVHENNVGNSIPKGFKNSWFIGFANVTSPTNHRTMITTLLPKVAVGHSIPIILFPIPSLGSNAACFLSIFNSFIFDYIGRQKLGGINYTFYIIKQLPTLLPDHLIRECPWTHSQTLKEWITTRVLELSYTSHDLSSFANDCGYTGPPFRWDEERRFLIRCELDAAFFHLYGLARDEVDYIMDTFPIVKRKDEQQYGEYRTKRVILEIYDALTEAMQTGRPYRTPLAPPPGDPRAAHQGS